MPEGAIRLHDFEGEVEGALKWWQDYPVGKFNKLTRANDMLHGFVSDAYQRPHRLARSASTSRVDRIREFQFDQPIGSRIVRSPSVSSLSPSHALPYDQRVARRYIPSVRSYQPETGSWYPKTYAPVKFYNTMNDTSRPYRYVNDSPLRRASRVQEYVFKTKRKFFDARQISYVQGSERYMNNYVSYRLRMLDHIMPHVYNSYDYGRPDMHRFNRHLLLGSKVFVSPPIGLSPRYYASAWHSRNLYRQTERFYFDGY